MALCTQCFSSESSLNSVISVSGGSSVSNDSSLRSPSSLSSVGRVRETIPRQQCNFFNIIQVPIITWSLYILVYGLNNTQYCVVTNELKVNSF